MQTFLKTLALALALTLLSLNTAAPAAADSGGPGFSPIFVPALPDLRITGAAYHPNTPSIGTVVFTVKNTGTANSSWFRIAVHNAYNGQPVKTFGVRYLPVGAERTFSYQTTCPMKHSIWADSTQRIQEYSESNNAAMVQSPCVPF